MAGTVTVIQRSVSIPIFRSKSSGPYSWRSKVPASSRWRASSILCNRRQLRRGGIRASSSSVESLEENDSLVVCFGEMLIDFVPTVNGVSLAEAPAFKKAPGGAPANVAVGIARLGGSSAFIGKVGEDEFGFMLADILKENNVNNEGMRFDPAARTALAFVTLRKDGEREFMFYRNPSADMLLEEYELDLEIIRKAKIFHYGSISLITEPCKSAHKAAAKAAKEAGVLLSYDPNLRLPLWPSSDSAREGILSIWDSADVIKVSEEEISFLTKGEDPHDDAVVSKLIHPNLKLLLVTEGAEGCRYYAKKFRGRVGGLKVDAVDTTGAGDAFVAGILSQLASDISLLQVKWAGSGLTSRKLETPFQISAARDSLTEVAELQRLQEEENDYQRRRILRHQNARFYPSTLPYGLQILFPPYPFFMFLLHVGNGTIRRPFRFLADER